MKRDRKKLTLRRDTVRNLRVAELRNVAGAGITGSCADSCWPDNSCTCIPTGAAASIASCPEKAGCWPPP